MENAIDCFHYQGIEYRRFNHLFFVSKCGKFMRNFHPYTPTQRGDGYLGVGRQKLAHRVVATVWCHKPEGANHVHHINHNKADNRAQNLEWLTPKTHFAERHEGQARGHKMSEAGKARLRALRTGSVTSEATKQKQREANLRLGIKPPPRPVGTKLSMESRLKCRNNPRNLACVIAGVAYPSVSEAARSLGMNRLTVRQRILSQNFTDYNYAEPFA